MRYFLEKFEETYDSKENPFGFFSDDNFKYYPDTGTHIGADFRVAVGTPVFAPAVGELYEAKFNPYKGNIGIYIFKHGGVEWGLELCHLKELPKKGKYEEGEIIAYSGKTGKSITGPHVHAVLHRNAWVTKNYGEMHTGGRERFLELEKEGRIVNCYEWFCTNIKEEAEEEPKPESISKPKSPSPKIKSPDGIITCNNPETKSILGIIKRLLNHFVGR